MSSGALFPTLVPGSRGSSSKYLVEFRAGKMSLKGSTVTPDKRKGLVYIQQTDDSLIHFCWKDRTSGNVEDDLIIFPDDCEFKRVSQCTTGRVYVLKFKAGSKRLFFWMQEPKTEKDEEHCRKVNEYLNNPPMPGALGGSGSGGHELSALGGEGGLQSLLGNMSHNQLMQLIGPTGLGGLEMSTSNITRIGKKASSTSSSASSSPSKQRSIESMLQVEKCNAILKEILAMLQTLQETMTKNHNEIRKYIGEVRNNMGEIKQTVQHMDAKLEKFQQRITKNEQRIQKEEEKSEQIEKKVDDINYKLTQANELQNTVIMLETEKAAHYLRFQNIEEEKGEDLPEIMEELLAKALGIDKQKMEMEMDEIFRIHTIYARRHKLPREVHVRFVKKSIRDKILNKARDEPLQYKGKQLVVLKHIPRRVRDLRKQYHFLTSVLIKCNVNFRWLIPVGILVTWQKKKYRLDSLDKAMKFYDCHFNTEGEQETRGETVHKGQEVSVMEERHPQQDESELEKKRIGRAGRSNSQRTQRNKRRGV
uniref:ADRM1 26S proteasome ubiquitin receptor n=1 Tax=Naja naja TaxID=35670 RepID=A0A8C6VAK8_NAJNA